jgi:uncharacterized membrane protein
MNEAPALQMQSRFLWTRYVMFAMGFWLMVTPATFAQHSLLVTENEVICGVLVMVFSLFALSFKRLWAPWLLCAIGVWLQFAPLIFWAPSAVGYLNDTAVGAALILLSIIIPGTPGGVELKGAEVPPGWSYNPASWNQRLPIILLAFLAWMSSRYMAAYQLGYIDFIWDPIFKDGTQKVVTSPLSKSFPISDAGLGALVYTLEVLMGFKGSTRRWYTMPWIVFLFGIMVVPAGFVSILLIMLQPLIVGYWCSWCLLTAVCMLIMIALTLDEVVAVCQYLASVLHKKQSLWTIFWKGGSYQEGELDTRSPPLDRSFKKNFDAMLWGVSFPWNLILSILLGATLMFIPSFIPISPKLKPDDYIMGALVVTLSFIALAEVLRVARFLNILIGIWVLIFTLISLTQERSFYLFHIIWSLVTIAVNIPKGPIKERYGTWDRYIR